MDLRPDQAELVGAHIIRSSITKGDDSTTGMVSAIRLCPDLTIRTLFSIHLELRLGTYSATMLISLMR
jgi:hypothetical protein